MEVEDYNFVDTLDQDFVCTVCLELLKQPYLTECCGNHFCRACYEGLQRERLSCPLCKDRRFVAMEDKFFQRKIDEIPVRCTLNREKGCDWIGGTGVLQKHLNESCKFVVLSCKHHGCGKTYERRNLEEHESQLCHLRPYTCEYCLYAATFEGVTKKHYSECKKYPLPCPNRCGIASIERQHQSEHVEKDCPDQLTSCVFDYAGCHEKMLRKNISDHLNKNVDEHFDLTTRICQTIDTEYLGQIQNLDEQIANLHSRIEVQKQEIEHLESAATHMNTSVLFTPPIEFIMTRFAQHKIDNDVWTSPPFYSNKEGYKLCLKVYANGDGDAVGNQVSVYAYLMRGDHDATLKWPFEGEIVISILQQGGRTPPPIEKSVKFNYKNYPSSCERVINGEMASEGLGYRSFVAHDYIQENSECLKCDCIRLRVCKINL